ncbi:DUF982 domain-containing protein [Mesorhizobium sp. M7A.F.Ca.MR.245.00.0.0]|uniref:DUF982 domain-containing protein n=1 Tax=Mesorhizobium sp. M7A.F.Ca.MR.245.00.0.0 TaxID=2496778 RepID=UPI000FCCB280|nr:DUF982 domain-containing protein [Mesorhizobium sp. M7A.F.Ca.MR.245.00.0.0]RUV18892.1 DUF982 domain-containing protein [Mesorhizobium sp. M7A.F.Ca.MR.245.00.0.0]RUV49060.1 DUF982 domain-containing protein [Mesorhizobium sp. M7A.F.Ca.MR.228.00.0.0]
MALHWFSPVVPVRTEKVGITLGVSNVEAAAEELMKWPEKGPKWNKAVQLCIDCFEDRASPQDVQKAFEEAAKEQGMLRSL